MSWLESAVEALFAALWLAFAVLTVASLFACWPAPTPPDCTTPRGMELRGSADCAGFEAAEDRAVRTLEARGVFGDVSGVAVHIVPSFGDGRFVSFGVEVWGQTQCIVPPMISVIDLGTDDWRLHGSLTHELGHHFQGCAPGHPADSWGCKDCDDFAGIYGAARESRILIP